MSKMYPSLKIENKVIDAKSPVYFIADIAANHDGDLSRAKDLIYKAAESGADAAKFQHFKAKTIVSDYGFKSLGKQLSHQSSWKKSVYEVYNDASVKYEWSHELKETCDQAGITFFTTPYSMEALEELDKFVPAFKIGSGDITWIEFIEAISSKQKPYILATGASSLQEVDEAVTAALKINKDLCLMQCNTNYTASLDNFKYINLNVLNTYSTLYPDIILGLSDHTPGHTTVLGAVALGARMVEKHFTDDNARKGPDHLFSMNPNSWKEMVERTRELENALGTSRKFVEKNEEESVVIQRRSLRAKLDIKKGSIINKDMFEPLRPSPNDAIKITYINSIEGHTLARDICKGDYLKFNDVYVGD